MIEYLEIRSKSTREIIGLIDSAKSIIWHSTYYLVGDFEIYVQASETASELLQKGNYVTRPDDNDEVGIIEHIESENTIANGKMIIAKGRYAKSILDRRHIYKLSGKVNTPTIISGNVESAVRSLVSDNAINCSFDSNRNMSALELGALSNITKVIVDANGATTQKQVSFENLYDYSEEVLKEYEMAAKIILNDDTGKLQYKVYEGTDRTAENPDGNEAVIFSQEYDNLNESKYTLDTTAEKNCALVGGQGEGLDRFYSLVASQQTDIDRRETWVNASSLNKKYKDQQNVEHEYSDSVYKMMLDAQARQQLSTLTETQNYEANININNGQYKLNVDYFLGDIVTFQDNKLNKYADVRILELTEVQDENGYSIEPTFEFISVYDYLLTESGQRIITETGINLTT